MLQKKKKKKIKKYYKNCDLVHFLLCLQRIRHNLCGKMKFLKQASYIGYVIRKLLKFVQISMQTSSDSFLQRILKSSENPWSYDNLQLNGKKFFQILLLLGATFGSKPLEVKAFLANKQ